MKIALTNNSESLGALTNRPYVRKHEFDSSTVLKPRYESNRRAEKLEALSVRAKIEAYNDEQKRFRNNNSYNY